MGKIMRFHHMKRCIKDAVALRPALCCLGWSGLMHCCSAYLGICCADE